MNWSIDWFAKLVEQSRNNIYIDIAQTSLILCLFVLQEK